MKIYGFEFEGLWLGGRALVVSDSPERAMEVLEAYAKKHNVPEFVDVELVSEVEDGVEDVIFIDDGDY